MTFTLRTFTGLDPEYLSDADRDLYTAQHWTLHLRTVVPELLAAELRSSGAEVLTGDFVGGDSFRQWCEKPEGYEDLVLHVYFRAGTLEQATSTAEALCASVGILDPKDAALSTALDWAEQAPLWAKS